MATACNLAGAAKVSAALALSTSFSGQRVDSSSLSLRIPGRQRRACELARCDASNAAEEQAQQFDTKEFRRTLTRGENYNRSGYGYKKEMLKQMDVEYTSEFLLPLQDFRDASARTSL